VPGRLVGELRADLMTNPFFNPLNSQLLEQFELKNGHRAASECLMSLDQHQLDFR